MSFVCISEKLVGAWGRRETEEREGNEEKEEKKFEGFNVLYIQTNFGSVAVGLRAIPSALPNAFCNKKIAMTKHFILGGAFVKAYSNPVTLAKISLMAIKKYAGAWTATWILFGWGASSGDAGQASGKE